MTDLYQEILLEEAKHPRWQGELTDADVTLRERNASCGDQLTIFVKLDPTKQKIAELRWQGQGCVISQAAMSVVAAKVQGMAVSELPTLTESWLLAQLGMETISPGRVKCLLLGLSGLRSLR